MSNGLTKSLCENKNSFFLRNELETAAKSKTVKI